MHPSGWPTGSWPAAACPIPKKSPTTLSSAPPTPRSPHVVQVAGTRWQVEQAFELAKQEVGLGEYEVRHWAGWYRHVTLALFALAYLTVVRQHAQKKGRSHTKKAAP